MLEKTCAGYCFAAEITRGRLRVSVGDWLPTGTRSVDDRLVPNKELANSKCFIRRRLGAGSRSFSPSVVPTLYRISTPPIINLHLARSLGSTRPVLARIQAAIAGVESELPILGRLPLPPETADTFPALGLALQLGELLCGLQAVLEIQQPFVVSAPACCKQSAPLLRSHRLSLRASLSPEPAASRVHGPQLASCHRRRCC